jgi:hypothetical protein
MARASLLLALLAVAATAVAGARVPVPPGTATGPPLAAYGGNASSVVRRRAAENGLGRTPQMGYVRYAAIDRFFFVFLPCAAVRSYPPPHAAAQ